MALEVKGMKFLLDRKYYIKNGSHLWLKQEGNMVKIGMDPFFARMTNPLTALNVTKKQVKSGEEIGSFESSKFVSKIYSPISGDIIAVNDKVLSNPQKINENPYDSWIFVMKSDKNVEEKYIIEDKDKVFKWINKEIKRLEAGN